MLNTQLLNAGLFFAITLEIGLIFFCAALTPKWVFKQGVCILESADTIKNPILRAHGCAFITYVPCVCEVRYVYII